MTGLSFAGESAAARFGPLLVAESLAEAPLIDEVFAGVVRVVVPLDLLRVTTPWEGPLFALFDDLVASRAGSEGEAASGGAVAPPPAVGLAVPVVWTASDPAPEVVLIVDHVNLTLRGPLSGRRPPSGPPVFPSLSAIYQPSQLRPFVRGRVYSEVAVAGVADAGRLTRFERRALVECSAPAVCDCLVDTVIVAAHHGLQVVACGIPQATRKG